MDNMPIDYYYPPDAPDNYYEDDRPDDWDEVNGDHGYQEQLGW